MTDSGLDLEPYIERLNQRIVVNQTAIILGFVILTVVFAGGLGLLTLEEDQTDAFTSELPEQEAYESIQDEFGDPFEPSADSTQLIQLSDNVLSQRELLRNLKVAEQAESRSELRIDSTTGPASIIAQEIDSDAESAESQRRTIERATRGEIRQAIRTSADNDSSLEATLSDDFNRESATASASITVFSHSFSTEEASDADLEEAQLSIQSVATSADGDLRVFGEGIINAEFGNIIGDSLAIVVPAVFGLIFLFLIIAYRDPFDLILGVGSLLMALVWTFGTVGYLGIPFDQNMVTVPVLLAAIGIDFGIHLINRYREEHTAGSSRQTAMIAANQQLAVAFGIVTASTVFGFGANAVSDLGPTQNFAVVASFGIVYTYLIFSVFLPAAKLSTDRYREQFGIPAFGTRPLATERSWLGRLLAYPANVSYKTPVVAVLLLLVVTAGAVGYGQDIDRTFDEEDFLPPEELPAYIQSLPGPFAPGEYTVTREINFLDDNFEASQDDQITMYIEGNFEQDHALESLDRETEDPPETFITTDRKAETDSIITVIQDHAEKDSEFADLVERNDRSGTGVPDRNLERIYDELLESSASSQAEQHLTDDRQALRVDFDVESDATQTELTADARTYSEQFRGIATPTGSIIVFEAVSEIILESAIQSLIVAIGLTVVFLIFIYWLLERQALLGLVNMFPILVSLALLLATMRVLGLSFNALTATILSVTIGIGIDHSVHITHRFIDEYHQDGDVYRSITVTLYGTGGALTGSMLTTSVGISALMLAITPVLGEFGLLMAISIFLAYLASLVALPPAVFVWDRYTHLVLA